MTDVLDNHLETPLPLYENAQDLLLKITDLTGNNPKPSANIHPLLLDAFNLSDFAHAEQIRKYSGDKYIAHLLGMCLKAHELQIQDVWFYIAIFSHDIPEDQAERAQEWFSKQTRTGHQQLGTTAVESIGLYFGDEIKNIVEAMTLDELPKTEDLPNGDKHSGADYVSIYLRAVAHRAKETPLGGEFVLMKSLDVLYNASDLVLELVNDLHPNNRTRTHSRLAKNIAALVLLRGLLETHKSDTILPEMNELLRAEMAEVSVALDRYRSTGVY